MQTENRPKGPEVQVKEDKVDINTTASTKKGFLAAFENVFRKFQTLCYVFLLLPIGMLYVIGIGTSLTPGFLLFDWASQYLVLQPMILKALGYGMCAGMSFVFFIFTIIFVVPLMNLPFRPFVKSYRGAWFSIESIPWFYHNSLTYLVRYTILDFITPSPLNILFFKMMGMKIGKGSIINTSNVSDPCLIEIDDYVTIGGSVYMMAHYGMKGFLIIDRLVIKKGAMVGLGAILFGGVTIGAKATVLPNVAVLPKTVIKDGEKFGMLAGPL